MTETDIQNNEDEIDIVKNLLFLWGKKKFILSGTLIFIIIATIVSFYLPKSYQMQVETQLSHPKGMFKYYNKELERLKNYINEGKYNDRIQENLSTLDLRLIPDSINCKFVYSTIKQLFTICFGVAVSDVEFGEKVLKSINPILLEGINRIIEESLKDFNKTIQREQIQLNESSLHEKQKLSELENVIKRESFIDAMIADTKSNNIELRIKQKKILVLSEQKNSTNLLVALLYSHTIQQNLYMINSLTNERNWIWHGKQIIKEDLDNLAIKIKENKTKIRRNENLIKQAERRIDLQPPRYSNSPNKQKKKLIIIGLSGIAGLFLMTLTAYFIEYFTNIKKQIDNRID